MGGRVLTQDFRGMDQTPNCCCHGVCLSTHGLSPHPGSQSLWKRLEVPKVSCKGGLQLPVYFLYSEPSSHISSKIRGVPEKSPGNHGSCRTNVVLSYSKTLFACTSTSCLTQKPSSAWPLRLYNFTTCHKLLDIPPPPFSMKYQEICQLNTFPNLYCYYKDGSIKSRNGFVEWQYLWY